ncbi:scab [Carabus blaptoides fortunei]
MNTRILCSAVLFVVLYTNVSRCFNLDTSFPIIYLDPAGNSARGSYFGYSVILHDGSHATRPWVQIGAPRGNHSFYDDYKEPGIVYRCPIKGACKLFPIDSYGKAGTTGKTRTGTYKNKKDGAWIGGHMDIHSHSQRVVVCGHRWINANYPRDWYISGACYWSTLRENETEALLPLVNRDKYVFNNQIYNYAMGQVGMAVHLPSDSHKPELLLGAPGIFNWEGSPILYRDSEPVPSEPTKRSIDPTHFSDLNMPDMSQITELHSFAYFGYSLSSGYFNSRRELLYVAGAPRSSMYRGQIVIFNFRKRTDSKLSMKYTRSGLMVGEYFGASVAVANINGDEFDDIIVGAPHYSSKCDEGRVFVFLGNAVGNLLTPVQSATIEGHAYGGQFGLAIQSLGDIDLDGFADVAIGAPYEDDMHGVVYIYNGGQKGLSLKPSQKIIGKRVFPTLKGFGISFSRPTDIDNNRFHDIAIGSYLSNHAVILRTRPVVRLSVSVESEVARLDSKAKSFVIKICHSYSGSFLPSSLDVNRTLTIDELQNRAYIIEDSKQIAEFSKTVKVVEMNITCENITIRIKDKVANFLTPIEITVTQELIQKPVKSNPILITQTMKNSDRFCKECPIVHPTLSQSEEKLGIPFVLDCGDDNMCTSDLIVSGAFNGLGPENKFVIGSKYSLPLEISVLNIGESAYLTEVEVALPESVDLNNIPSFCSENKENNTLIVLCEMDEPLRKNSQKNITLDLDMSEIKNIGPSLTFKILSKSNSEELNPKDNEIELILNLAIEANLTIKGNSEKDSYYYGNHSLSNATHIYEVQKSGASPINQVILNISIPVAIQTSDGVQSFMRIYEPVGFQSGQSFTCQWEDSSQGYFKADLNKKETIDQLLNPEEPLNPEETELTATRSKRSTTTTETLGLNIDDNLPLNRTVFINCSQSEVICKSVSCIIGPFMKFTNVARLQIKMVLNMTVLTKYILGKKDIIYLSTDGFVEEIEGNKNDKLRVSNIFLAAVPIQEVDLWIIIVSIIAGILILLLVILGLIKAGFFKRTHKEELEALKQAEQVAEEFEIGREPSMECNSEPEDQ